MRLQAAAARRNASRALPSIAARTGFSVSFSDKIVDDAEAFRGVLSKNVQNLGSGQLVHFLLAKNMGEILELPQFFQNDRRRQVDQFRKHHTAFTIDSSFLPGLHCLVVEQARSIQQLRRR